MVSCDISLCLPFHKGFVDVFGINKVVVSNHKLVLVMYYARISDIYSKSWMICQILAMFLLEGGKDEKEEKRSYLLSLSSHHSSRWRNSLSLPLLLAMGKEVEEGEEEKQGGEGWEGEEEEKEWVVTQKKMSRVEEEEIGDKGG